MKEHFKANYLNHAVKAGWLRDAMEARVSAELRTGTSEVGIFIY